MAKLNIEIKMCIQCPYNKKNEYYDAVHSSGWDCQHPEIKIKRIADVAIMSIKITSKIYENHHSKINKMENFFPEWCPLLNKESVGF